MLPKVDSKCDDGVEISSGNAICELSVEYNCFGGVLIPTGKGSFAKGSRIPTGEICSPVKNSELWTSSRLTVVTGEISAIDSLEPTLLVDATISFSFAWLDKFGMNCGAELSTNPSTLSFVDFRLEI